MRTLLRVTPEVVKGNSAIIDGSLPEIFKETMQRLNPEAAYFFADNGNRSCIMVFDMKDPSDIPSIAEPFFIRMNAKVEFLPVMNAEDLEKGLKTAMKNEYEMVH